MHDLKLNIWLSSSSTAVHNKTFVDVKVVFFFVSFIIIFREPIGSLDKADSEDTFTVDSVSACYKVWRLILKKTFSTLGLLNNHSPPADNNNHRFFFF